MKVTTDSGFECEINENVLDDIEILEMIEAIDDGRISMIRKVLGRILKDDAARLEEHVRTEDGRIPVTALLTEFQDFIAKIKDLKK